MSSDEGFSSGAEESNDQGLSSSSRAATEESLEPRALVRGGTAGYASVLALLEAALPNFVCWSRLQQLPHKAAMNESVTQLNSSADSPEIAHGSTQSAWQPPHSPLPDNSASSEESHLFNASHRDIEGPTGVNTSRHNSKVKSFSSSDGFDVNRSSSIGSDNNIARETDSNTEKSEHEHVDRITAMFLEPLSMVLLTCGREIKAWEVTRPNMMKSTPQSSRDQNNEAFSTTSSHSILNSGSWQGSGSGSGVGLDNGSVRPLWLARTRFNDRAVAVHALGFGSNSGSHSDVCDNQNGPGHLGTLSGGARGVCAVSSFDAYVSILDLASGTLLRTLNLKADHASCLCLFRPIPEQNADLSSPQSESEPPLLACGTAYRRLLVFDCSISAPESSRNANSSRSNGGNGSGDANGIRDNERGNSKFGSRKTSEGAGNSAITPELRDSPLVASAMVAHGRALSLKFMCHDASNSPHRRHRVGSDGELKSGVDNSIRHLKKRQPMRRSSLDSSSSYDRTSFSSNVSHQHVKLMPSIGSPVALVIGLTDGSVLHWHLGRLASSAASPLASSKTPSSLASSNSAFVFPTMERILVSPSSLASMQGPVTFLAAPLLSAVSAEEGVGAQVRLALVARLFEEVARGHLQSSSTGSDISNQPVDLKGTSHVGSTDTSTISQQLDHGAIRSNDPNTWSSSSTRATRSDELLACADALCQEVALIEAQAPIHETQSRNFESAVPGLRNFTARLKMAAALGGGGKEGDSPRNCIRHSAATPDLDGRFKGPFQANSDDADAAARMLTEFEVHLRHLLTFPSAQACKTLNLDLHRWEATHASMNGLGRRKLLPLQNGSHPIVTSNSLPKGGVVERPFVHSDLEPHPPVYQVTSDVAGDVLVSLGRDRLLRVWDLGTGTPLRALPVSSQDVPLTSTNGVVVCVVGERSRSFSVWATPNS